MLTKDFYFDLPDDLIAQFPSGVRGQDKLMHLYKDGRIEHCTMDMLPDLISPETLMVFNNSRVRASRCYGKTEDTGREAEFLFIANETPSGAEKSVWRAMVKNAKKQKPGKVFVFPDGTRAQVADNPDDMGTEFRTMIFDRFIDENWFETNGHIPLPPYIKRGDTKEDAFRYQNVYAKETGSSACPTAGLHFTEEMLEHLSAKGIETAYVTLHVGLGTFLPVRAENITDHKMHEELFTVSPETAEKINRAKREGRPVLAVGTTSVRTLESAWEGGNVSEGGGIKSGTRKTSIFIYPGYTFKCVDKMFTNFHTPESTLMMLVSAFAGRDNIMNAYQTAVKERYRFFSYGDAMFIE
ncbi:MAG: tRNA preQ1(34) S-adenosylmethionine ribosyltransferase-isomerase QueA [Treponemataceae bacterium]|nr:tRNA preQ1(34) S-adenosylmethionine ribosyltransferase-isomerase QueA [Treponemataceae bacterium]